MSTDRRRFLSRAGIGGVGALLVGCTSHAAPRAPGAPSDDDEVTPVEDLMREHGVLRRVMYLYDEAATRLEAPGGPDVPLPALQSAATIIRRVIEDYHEKLEEDFLFPRYEKAGVLVDLVAVLRRQHVRGRELTDAIVARAAGSDRHALASALRAFTHMYQPHASREDTILFPAFRALVGPKAYIELGEQFEAQETAHLGDHGFEHAVAEVAVLEKAFGVDDLATLTP